MKFGPVIGGSCENRFAITLDELKWKQYQKRPLIIHATCMTVPFKVETLEGWMEGRAGDWLIEGIEGELYPCKDRVFRATYLEVNNDTLKKNNLLLRGDPDEQTGDCFV